MAFLIWHIQYLNKVDAEEDGDAVKAVADVAVCVLHQQLDRLPKDVVEDLQGRGGVKDKEFRHKEKFTTGVVHHGILQDDILLVWLINKNKPEWI